MPTYCYKFPDGRIVERIRPMSDSGKLLREGGLTAQRCLQAEMPYVASKKKAKVRLPRRAREDLGVHPNQVAAMNDMFRRRGCPPCHFDRTGIAYPEDRGHVKKMMRARGMVNTDKKGVGDVDPHTPLAQCVVDNV